MPDSTNEQVGSIPCATGCRAWAEEPCPECPSKTERVRSWFCETHRLWTTGDCSQCDDELIALHDEPPPAEACFYCRRGMHSACLSGEQPCPCEPHEED